MKRAHGFIILLVLVLVIASPVKVFALAADTGDGFSASKLRGGSVKDTSTETSTTGFTEADLANLKTKNSFENVNQKVTSLKEETSSTIDKNEFIDKFMDIFKKDYDLFLEKGFAEFRVEYKSYLNCLNKEISLKNGENTITGIAKDVTNSGMLLLETDGKIQEISAGDISY